MRSTAIASGNRLIYIDLLKALASSLIVLHHLAFYGPMADYARSIAPWLIDGLADYGRIAVQVFLVMGGFLAAKSFSNARHSAAGPVTAIRQRFFKLVPPYLVAVLFAAACAALARTWMTHPSIPATPTLWQLLAHALLLQDILGIDSLSAGLWYVAIDFQLYAGMAVLVWLTTTPNKNVARLLPVSVAYCGMVSLLFINRHPEWDVWGAYFFGSYALGALAWWASGQRRTDRSGMPLIGIMLTMGAVALLIDFRLRILVALLASLTLAGGARGWFKRSNGELKWIGFLGRNSYALLLVHFPVCMVVNAFFQRFVAHDPLVQCIGMLIAWGASLTVAALFHEYVELPLVAMVSRKAVFVPNNFDRRARPVS